MTGKGNICINGISILFKEMKLLKDKLLCILD